MVPTNHFRWNVDESVYKDRPMRLEQLWEDRPPIGPGLRGIDGYHREWRPLPMVRVGWSANDYHKPLPAEETGQ